MRRIFELRSRLSSRRSLLAVKVRKHTFTRFTAGRSSSRKIFAKQIFCGSPEKRSLRVSVGSCPNLHHTISLFRFSHSLRSRAPATAICNPSPHSIGFRYLRRIFELRSHSPSVTYFVATQPFGGKSTQACFYALYGRSLLFPQNLCEANLLREP